MIRKLSLITLLLFLTTFLIAQESSEINPYRLHEKVGKLISSAPPEFWEGHIFFTYQSAKKVRAVGIAFEHEKYSKIHYFKKNKSSVFFYPFPVPEREDVIYRLVIDGVWMPDPMAPEEVYDNSHRAVSRVRIGDFRKYVNKKSPFISKETGKVVFIIKDKPKRQIFIAGDFNNWDPYMMPLTERSTSELNISEYRIEISLPPGSYLYVYYVDGEKMLDPINRRQSVNQYGEISSIYYSTTR